MSVLMYEVGELCVHKGFICRVEKINRKFAKGLEYMGVKDGVEFNPTLVLIPIYGPNNEKVKAVKPRATSSGAVERLDAEIKSVRGQIDTLNKRLALLTSVKDKG